MSMIEAVAVTGVVCFLVGYRTGKIVENAESTKQSRLILEAFAAGQKAEQQDRSIDQEKP